MASREPVPKEDPYTLQNMLALIPGELQMDRAAIAEGKRMERAGEPGWSMFLLRGIGIKPENIPAAFGFCRGCLSSAVATAWFVRNFALHYPNDAVQLSESYVMLTAKRFDPVYNTRLPFTYVDWQTEPYRGMPTQLNQKVIEDCIKSFRESEQLRWYLFLTEMRTSPAEGHVMFTVVSREKWGDVALKVETYDPNGYAAASHSVDKFLQKQLLAAPRNPFTYAISGQSLMQCSGKSGVQALMYSEPGRENMPEPRGYCAVWSSVFIFLSFFVGPGKTFTQMQEDLRFCVERREGNWPDNLTRLARTLSLGFAHIFRMQGRPPSKVCEVTGICCLRGVVKGETVIPPEHKDTERSKLVEVTYMCGDRKVALL